MFFFVFLLVLDIHNIVCGCRRGRWSLVVFAFGIFIIASLIVLLIELLHILKCDLRVIVLKIV